MDKFQIIVCILTVALMSFASVIVINAKQSQQKITSTVNIKTERIEDTHYRLITLPDGRRFIAYTHWIIPLDTVEPHDSIEKE